VGFNSLLKREHTRLGKELAVYAGISTGIYGIIHSDELPGFGITENEIKEVKEILYVKNEDAFVLAMGQESIVNDALNAVVERALIFFDGVPEEVRRSLPDFTTEYMRPLPGAARMYPETDVPPIRITKDRLKRIKLPESPEDKYNRFISQYKTNPEQTKQILSSGFEGIFENLVKLFPDLKNVIIRTLLNTFSELENEGISIDKINDKMLSDIFSALSEDKYAKEAVPDILKYLAKHKEGSIKEAIEAYGLGSIDNKELVKIVNKIVSQKKNFVKERGIEALGPLMGIVMKELRGKADGNIISKILREEIQKVISS